MSLLDGVAAPLTFHIATRIVCSFCRWACGLEVCCGLQSLSVAACAKSFVRGIWMYSGVSVWSLIIVVLVTDL